MFQRKLNLADHWTLDKKFLEIHTKAGSGGLMEEAGFIVHFNQQKHNEDAFDKLLGDRHESIVSRITAHGFSFKGFIPTVMRVTAK